MFCASEESFEDSTLFDDETPDVFYRAICPDLDVCHKWTARKIKLLEE